MSTKKMEQFILSIIEDYLDDSLDIASVLTDSDIKGLGDEQADELEEEIKETIDASSLAKLIGDSISGKVLTYSAFQTCNSCYRPMGQWESGSGGTLQEVLIMKPGITILVLDDF